MFVQHCNVNVIISEMFYSNFGRLCMKCIVIFMKQNGHLFRIRRTGFHTAKQHDWKLHVALEINHCMWGLQSLSSTVAFGFGWTYVAVYEQQGIGMQWPYVASSPMPGDNFNLLMCMVLMLLDALIYGLITWYIEAVFPGMFTALIFNFSFSGIFLNSVLKRGNMILEVNL